MALSIKNGLNVEVERFGPLIAESAADAAWGAYDPLLSADARYDVIKSPNINVFNSPQGRDPSAQTNRDRIAGGGVGVTQLLPYVGATVDLRLDSSGTATRSTLSPLDDRYDSGLFLSANVPLLRNLIWNSSWTNVKLAAYQGEAAEQQFRQALMDSVRSTINSYWGLVAARDQVRVAQKSLETARALLDQTRTQYEVGVVSQVEVVEAEAGVAEREFELIRTANLYRNAQDQLIDAVLGRELDARTDLQIMPTADLSSYELLPINVEQSVDQGFREATRAAPPAERDPAGRGRSHVRQESAASPARRPIPIRIRGRLGRIQRQRELLRAAAAGSASGRHLLGRLVRQLPGERRRGQLPGPGRLLDSDSEYGGSEERVAARNSSCARRSRDGFDSSRASSSKSAPRAGRCSPPHRASKPRSAGAWPPRSSCAPSASGSNTVSRRPSRSCSARTISSTPRARRSSRCRPSARRRRRSSEPRERFSRRIPSRSMRSGSRRVRHVPGARRRGAGSGGRARGATRAGGPESLRGAGRSDAARAFDPGARGLEADLPDRARDRTARPGDLRRPGPLAVGCLRPGRARGRGSRAPGLDAGRARGLPDEIEWVAVHDAARPLVRSADVARVARCGRASGGRAPGGAGARHHQARARRARRRDAGAVGVLGRADAAGLPHRRAARGAREGRAPGGAAAPTTRSSSSASACPVAWSRPGSRQLEDHAARGSRLARGAEARARRADRHEGRAWLR